MSGGVREILAGITTVGDMVMAFQDENRCRRLLEAMVWPRGRICPAWGHDKSCTQIHATLDEARTQTNEEPAAGRSGVTVAAASVVKLSG